MAPQVTIKFDQGLSKQQLAQALTSAAVYINADQIDLRYDRDVPLKDFDERSVGTLYIRN